MSHINPSDVGATPEQPDNRAPAGLPHDVESSMFQSLNAGTLSPQRSQAMKQRLMQRVRAQNRPHLTTIHATDGEWRPFLPKVSIKSLQHQGDTLTYLLRLEPGAILVPHDHPQDEECIVLEGEVRIGTTLARQGDYHLAPKGIAHDTIVSDSGALLFLRGAVPSARQVHWGRLSTLAAFSPEPLRNFIRRHWPD